MSSFLSPLGSGKPDWPRNWWISFQLQDEKRQVPGTVPRNASKQGSNNVWELSPGDLFHVKGCECAIRWDQQCTETSISLVGIRAATILCAGPSTRLYSIHVLLRTIIQWRYLSLTFRGKKTLILVMFFHEEMGKHFRHWQRRLKPSSPAGSPLIPS